MNKLTPEDITKNLHEYGDGDCYFTKYTSWTLEINETKSVTARWSDDKTGIRLNWTNKGKITAVVALSIPALVQTYELIGYMMQNFDNQTIIEDLADDKSSEL